jgi:hypothetical protein
VAVSVHSLLGILIVLGRLCTGHADPAEKVKVTVVVILASEGKPEVDARLDKIAQEIQKRNPNLKRFQLKSINCRSLAVDEKASFNLVDDKKAQVVVKQAADKDNRVGLAVTVPDQGEIVYRTACGKFLPIVTRYQTKMKERLILAIRVQPCNDE